MPDSGVAPAPPGLRRGEQPDPALTRFFGWMLILAAVALGVFTAFRTYDKLAAESWPSTHARVLSSGIYEQLKPRQWCVKLRYEYAVDGKAFVSKRLSTTRLGDAGCDPDRQVMEARLEQLQPGAQIQIRYRPGHPGTSIVYLDDLDVTDYLFVVIALICLAGGVKMLRDVAAMSAALPARHQPARADRFTHL